MKVDKLIDIKPLDLQGKINQYFVENIKFTNYLSLPIYELSNLSIKEFSKLKGVGRVKIKLLKKIASDNNVILKK